MFCLGSACYLAEGLSKIVKVLVALFEVFMNHAKISDVARNPVFGANVWLPAH